MRRFRLGLSKRQAVLAFAAGVFVVALLETTLGLLAFISPRVDNLLASPWRTDAIPGTRPDARLGHRPTPVYPGHDGHGFRNPQTLEKAHIVALGDSQTYGTSVEPEDAWPRQLESVTGKSVYSMSFGGYGPVHSLILWDEAAAMSPTMVVEAFYAGNDLFDAFNLVYNRGQLGELKSDDPLCQTRVREAEQTDPIAARVARLMRMATHPVSVPGIWAIPTRDNVGVRDLLARHSRIYGLLRRARYESRRVANQPAKSPQEEWETAKAFAKRHPAFCQAFEDAQFRTIFTSEYRLAALDLDDPRIAEGLQISLRAMQRMRASASAGAIRFLVVLIPTKEVVFHGRWQNPPSDFRRLAANEERVWRMVKAYFDENNIEYLDSLPALRKCLEAGIQPYKVTYDGHPNKYGHQAIAEAVAEFVESQTTMTTASSSSRPLR